MSLDQGATLTRQEYDSQRGEIMNQHHWLTFGIAIGAGVGTVVGILVGNIALGIALGAGVGVALGSAFDDAQHHR